MTTSTDLPPEQRRWTWDRPGGPRWLLHGELGFDSSADDVPLALCAEIDGLFVDLPPRQRERFTLIGCSPDGALADLLDRPAALGTEQAWLSCLALMAPPPPPGTPPPWWGEDLGDVVVLAQRPNTALPGTVDVDVAGFVQVYDRTDAVVRPDDMPEFVVVGRDAVPYGTCRDVTGLFREQAPPPVPQVRLIGCQPDAPLLTALAEVGQTTKASLRRRRIRADVYAIADDGSAGGVINGVVSGTLAASEPSRRAGLLDVTVDSHPKEPLPTGIQDVLAHWRAGRPSQKNLWAGYDRERRHHWAGTALTHSSRAPDKPPGTTYDLDGRHVTDIDGFYCALGEAINGPAGYFGWNQGALDDCLRGGFGARPPFRLTWHDSAVAQEHLVEGYDHLRLVAATTMADLLEILAEHHVEVDLR